MKKIFILVAGGLLLLGFGIPARAATTEAIRSYDVSVQIEQDGTLAVSEKILYDFLTNQKHGIYRDIPYFYRGSSETRRIKFSSVQITDEKGNSYPYETSYENEMMRLQIGDADKLITGEHWYYISYKVSRAIFWEDNADRVQWNAIGTGWEVPIDSASVTVRLPQALALTTPQTTCYRGTDRSTLACNDTVAYSTEGDKTRSVTYSGISDLGVGEGVSVNWTLPKGTLTKPNEFWEYGKWMYGMPVLALIWMWRTWSKKGKDPKAKNPVVAWYEPPDNLSPAEMMMVLKERVATDDISAEIINLAVKGFLKIERVESGKVFHSVGYKLIRLVDSGAVPEGHARTIFDGIFRDGGQTIMLKSLSGRFYTAVKKAQDQAQQSVIQKGYYPKSPVVVVGGYVALGIILAALLIVLNATVYLHGINYAAAVATGVIILIFAIFMPRPTQKGAETRALIKGLREYLSVAEKDRIKFHNAPEKSPERFEKLLPYAMALGVEKEWAKQFEGLYLKPPTWYEGDTRMFNVVIFASVMRSFNTSTRSVMAPPSSRGHGSFGGGGVGGGFGGGGGGSW